MLKFILQLLMKQELIRRLSSYLVVAELSWLRISSTTVVLLVREENGFVIAPLPHMAGEDLEVAASTP